jgi:hypothetical protein
MSTTTTRNSLVKPGYADAADIAVINTNMDTIDASFAKCNWAAAVAPTVNEDSGDGYAIGSFWFNTTGHTMYVAESVAVGAAVWRQIYPGGVSPVIATVDPTVNDDSGDGYAIGQIWYNTTGNKYFVAKDVTVGAAVWIQIPTTGTAWDIGAVEIRALTFQSDVATGTAPFTVASTTAVTNLNADTVDGVHSSTIIQANGSVNLTGTLNSTLVTGTAPITVSSTTVCTNLHAADSDSLEGIPASGFVKYALADAKGDMIVATANDTWARQAVGTDGEALISNSSVTNGVSWAKVTDGASRNLLINGGFTVNQYGVSQYTSTTYPVNNDDTYLVDQWVLLSDGNDVMDVWQDNATSASGQSASVLLQTETANKKAGIIQFIEAKNCRHALGQVVSLRFSCYTTSANPNSNVMAAVLSWSGTSDSLTSDVVSAWNAAGAAPTLVANWTYENTPTQLALVNDTWTEYKIENIAIDTSNAVNLAVFIWLDDTNSSVDDRLYISGVQLNVGSKCLPWAARSIATEFLACKRYLIVANADAAAYGHLGTAAANDNHNAYFEAPHPINWFKTAASVTKVGNWSINSVAVSAITSECVLWNTVLKVVDTGSGLTSGHAYLVFASNDTTGRVVIESRL